MHAEHGGVKKVGASGTCRPGDMETPLGICPVLLEFVYALAFDTHDFITYGSQYDL